MKQFTVLYIALCSSLLLTACKDSDDLGGGEDATAGNVIRVGGIDTDELVATASMTRGDDVDDEKVTKTDAENISWLVEPLETGLDITYGLSSNRSGTSRVAILKLLTTDGTVGGPISYSEDGSNKYAEYSFLYRDNSTGNPTSDPAIWHGNGAHFFEGLYIPDKIQYNASASTPETIDAVATKAPDLTTDQHNDGTTSGSLGNYTLLSRYLGMPSNYTINATVGRIKLPFRHRMSRVLAYILIDPEMGSDVKIQGYSLTDGKDDPTTTAIKFCNVKVLQGVKASYDNDTKHYVYTPQWTQARKVVPHFVGERASYNDRDNKVEDASNFIAYYDVNEKTYTYPDDDNWDVLNTYNYDATTGLTSDGAYQKVIYGKVPVYDLIVRPTYTSLANVMYDEENVSDSQTKQDLYTATNQIDFELTLSNGLQYSKRFTFDLNANYQTVVYLHISKERVDYNSSGSELWVETRRDDDYYGVNNQNGNTLSIAGSGWQRAYTNSEKNFDVTDGHQYKYDSEDMFAQYVTDEKWIEMLREACVGGAHHGDYFILDRNISIPAAAFPENFVFTGHLDGQDHTITLTDASYTPAHDAYEPYNNSSYTKYIKSGDSYVVFTPAGNTTYYQASGDDYTEISDMGAYSGSTAYTRAENAPTYPLVSQAWTKTEGAYFQKSGSDYTSIEDITAYLSAFNNKIYTKNADSYTQVAVDNLVSSGISYYKYENSVYTLIADISSYFGTIYSKNPEKYTSVGDKTNLDSNVTYYKQDGESYVQIPYADIAAYDGTIYTKDADSYTEVAVDNLESGKTYYYLNDTDYVVIDDISSYREPVYTKDPDLYTGVTDVTTLDSSGTYYYKDSGDNYVQITNLDEYIGVYSKLITYNYTAIDFYMFVHYEPAVGESTGSTTLYMFSGLNGKYSTAQESDATATWEANVHKEVRGDNTYWVPYKTDVDGWRAEVINLNVNGGTLFKSDVTYLPTAGATVTGYVHNCWQGSTYSNGTWSGGTKVQEYTPAIPLY